MIPKEILEGIKWDTHRKPIKGGQMCGIPRYGIKLIHEELEFEISCNGFRSQLQNREFCLTVFELYLQEIRAI